MWYDMRWMKTAFYLGAMACLVGIGIAKINPDIRLAGVICICVGAALIVYGFNGMLINLRIEKAFNKKGQSFLRRK